MQFTFCPHCGRDALVRRKTDHSFHCASCDFVLAIWGHPSALDIPTPTPLFDVGYPTTETDMVDLLLEEKGIGRIGS
jgi:uncharacterized protein (DUF983 family)